jgi:hypothetical protein
MADAQGLNLLTILTGSMEAELFCKHFIKALSSPTTAVKSMLNTYWTLVCKVLNRHQVCRWFWSLQMMLPGMLFAVIAM